MKFIILNGEGIIDCYENDNCEFILKSDDKIEILEDGKDYTVVLRH